MGSVAADYVDKIGDFDAQALTNTAWSYAKLSSIPSWILNALMGEAFKKV